MTNKISKQNRSRFFYANISLFLFIFSVAIKIYLNYSFDKRERFDKHTFFQGFYLLKMNNTT